MLCAASVAAQTDGEPAQEEPRTRAEILRLAREQKSGQLRPYTIFSEPGTTYRFQWSVYDDRDDSSRALQDAGQTADTTLRLPDAPGVTAGSERYLLAEVHAMNDDHPMWNRRVGIYLRPVGETFEVVGVEREGDPPDNLM